MLNLIFSNIKDHSLVFQTTTKQVMDQLSFLAIIKRIYFLNFTFKGFEKNLRQQKITRNENLKISM